MICITLSLSPAAKPGRGLTRKREAEGKRSGAGYRGSAVASNGAGVAPFRAMLFGFAVPRVIGHAGCDNGFMIGRRPIPERADRAPERLAELGEPIFDARRDFRVDGAGHEAVALEVAQGQRQHAL